MKAAAVVAAALVFTAALAVTVVGCAYLGLWWGLR